MKSKSKIPTLVALIILTLGVALGVFALRQQQIFRLGAETETAPKDVRISNIGDSSFTVSWTTDKQASGLVSFGESETNLKNIASDEITPQDFTHQAIIKNLKPQTDYFFKITSEGRQFDNQKVAWQATTAPAILPSQQNILVSGKVLTPTGQASANSLVYITIRGYLLSTATSQNSTFVIPLSSARTVDLSQFQVIDESNTLLEIFVNAGVKGIATAQIYPASAKPIPAIILGKVHDFKNLPPSSDSSLPEASLTPPSLGGEDSGFNVPQGTIQPASTSVTLDSLDEGEVITSTTPEFFGEAPAGASLEITLQSETITGQVTVDKNGEWKWAPAKELEEGSHKITISWKDEKGILRTLIRTFVVQAAEGPAFESTPSATLRASPSATPVVTPTSSPTTTPIITSTPSGTTPPIPDSGSLTPTIALFIMGTGILMFSFFLWKEAKDA